MAIPGIPVSEFDTLKRASAATQDEKIQITIQPLPLKQALQHKMPHPPDGCVAVNMSERGAGEYPYAPISASLPVPVSLEPQELTEESARTESGKTGGSQRPQTEGRLVTEEQLHFPPPPPLSRPPPQVMTALGPMPLPPEIRRRIPEKFVAKPIIEEREIYVAKKEVRERTVEIPHVQYEHRFANVPKALSVHRLLPIRKEIVKEIPREVYKPVIEEKVIEVPQGVKYVEVPVEVPCVYPPKIVPVPKTQYVERVVETIKPIVKERVIEVPQTVVKQVPKIKTVEIPYFVSRYVEKIVEIPYKPPASGALPPMVEPLPFSVSGLLPPGPFPTQEPTFPPSFAGGPPPQPFTIGPMPLSDLNEIKLPYEAKIEVKVTQPEYAAIETGVIEEKSADMKLTSMVPTEAHLMGQSMMGEVPSDLSNHTQAASIASSGAPPGVELPFGYSWGIPPDANKPPESLSSCLAPPSSVPTARPIMVTCPPEVGKVKFGGYLTDPDILTRQGVVPYRGFRIEGTINQLFPPLPNHPSVPMKESGTPDVATIDETSGANMYLETHPNWEKDELEGLNAERSECSQCMPHCGQ